VQRSYQWRSIELEFGSARDICNTGCVEIEDIVVHDKQTWCLTKVSAASKGTERLSLASLEEVSGVICQPTILVMSAP